MNDEQLRPSGARAYTRTSRTTARLLTDEEVRERRQAGIDNKTVRQWTVVVTENEQDTRPHKIHIIRFRSTEILSFDKAEELAHKRVGWNTDNWQLLRGRGQFFVSEKGTNNKRVDL